MKRAFRLPPAPLVLVVAAGTMIAGWGGQLLRETVALDGMWQIEDSVGPTDIPVRFTHAAPVPGMVNLATPAFPDVDQFDSKEVIANRVRKKVLPESARVEGAGVPRQSRNYFWYRRSFRAPAARAVATLQVNKAQFGMAVWLNDLPLGEYAGCFSAGIFDLTPAIRWKTENTLLIRIGAHPAVLPDTYPTGTDFEKLKWTPGIYDRVSVWFADNPVIETVQVAPRVASSEIVVQTRVRNAGPACVAELRQSVRPWQGGGVEEIVDPVRLELSPGESRLVTQTIRLSGARLWSPEDPFLYVIETATGGDSKGTRFGMREFRSDAATRQFYLNGRPYYLRGSNITLHRFFEDPDCGALPWDEKWLRRLLVEIPKKMHWNSFRFCIGPAPDRWFEIADEAGLLIQNEFFIWTGAPSWDVRYSRRYDVAEMIRQYGDWMRDHWNHPSAAIWDANNETQEELFGKAIIPAVRALDLSNRPWENSYNEPADPDDPVEYHPYLFHSSSEGEGMKFQMSDLETRDPAPQVWHLPQGGHPILINEYAWLWLNRDGSPTLLTDKLYPKLLGPNSTTEERFALYAYLLGAKTEYWRTSRQYAGILHFVYLTCSYPGVYTADHWRDVRRLQLEPHFADYLSEAFKPLGVYVNFFHPTLKTGESRTFEIRMVNDRDLPVAGSVRLVLETRNGRALARSEQRFSMDPMGRQVLQVPLTVPQVSGKCVLKAVAAAEDSRREIPTVSRRWVSVE